MSRGPHGRLANVAKCAILLKYCINKIKIKIKIGCLCIKGPNSIFFLRIYVKVLLPYNHYYHTLNLK